MGCCCCDVDDGFGLGADVWIGSGTLGLQRGDEQGDDMKRGVRGRCRWRGRSVLDSVEHLWSMCGASGGIGWTYESTYRHT